MDMQEEFKSGTEAAMERGAEMYEKGKQSAGEAYQKTAEVAGEVYGKTSKAMGEAYDEAVRYGRENPALVTLITFGVGLGIGLLLAGSLRRSRRSFTEPIVDAIHDFASDYLRS